MRNQITSNILEGISCRILGDIPPKGKNALIVFNGSDMDLDGKLRELKKLKEGGINFSVAFSFMAERILDAEKIKNSIRPQNIYKEEDIFKLKEISKEYNTIIGPNITISTLSKVSLGIIDGFIPNLIWNFLYEGKSVYLDFNAVKRYLGRESLNKEITSLTDGYIDTIKRMGALEINDYNILDREMMIFSNSDIKEEYNYTLITEKDIMKLSSNIKLEISRETIVTPLAKDKAKEKNIKIYRVGVE